MIRYDLACSAGHEFEGWFNSSAAFAEQAECGWVHCPHCGGVEIHQALATPAVVTRQGPVRSQAPARTPDEAGATVRQALRAVRAAVEQHCDNVGDRFVEEALRIDRGEAPERGIYGQADEAGRARLDEAGVAFLAIPWVPEHDG